jgi:competence protein ComEC
MDNKILLLNLLCTLFLACTHGSLENQDKLYIEMLNVGQGLSFLIKSKDCNSLYDTGTPNSGLDTMLQNRGIKTLCSVVLSHRHNDHTGGMTTLVKMAKNGEIRIKRVIYASDTAEEPLLALLKEAGIETREIFRGDTLAEFMPWATRILFPAQNSSLTENAASIAMRLSDSQNSFLFMGDLEAPQEKSILELEPLLSATALQAGHHGSRTSSSWDFLAQVQPKMAFISAGKNNSYGHPHPETLAKLRLILQDSTQIFRTDTDGSVELEWVYRVGMWSR